MLHRQTIHDLELLLIDINALLNNEEALKASDRFAGPGATKAMWLKIQAETTAKYIALVNNESHKYIQPTWQESYDLV